MIGFTCNGCHAALKIDDEWAGKLGNCPFCGVNSPVPGSLKRTPKTVIIVRWAVIPFLVVAFWGLLFCIADVSMGLSMILGGVLAIAGGIFWCWGFTNICTFLSGPREYKIWKAGGGDPFFDTLDSPLNNDPPEVRYQELYREKERQELEEVNRQWGISPPAAPDFSKELTIRT